MRNYLRQFMRRNGFQRQLMLIAAVSILALAIFSALMNAREANVRMRDYFTGQGQRIAENLARQSTLALLFHSAENAREVVGATLAFPDVSGVQIMDAQQRVLLIRESADQRPSLSQMNLTPPLQAGLISENSSSWLFAAPVYGGQHESSPLDPQESRQQLLGYVHVQITKRTLNSLTASLLLGNLVLTLSFAVLVLGIGRVLTRHMIRPLNALSALMRRAEAGESGMRAQPSGPRDLIDMAQAFNQMMMVLEQRECELKESRDAAINLAQLKAQFAATVSHEVRTPLNGVVGMLDMLRETRLTTRQQEFVDVAWNSSRTLIDLINNILDFSKLEAGKLTLEPKPFALSVLMDEVLELLAPQAAQKGLLLGWHADTELPPYVSGDSLRLRQIVLNLVGNAVKFTERGEVAISLAMLPAHAPTRLHITVSDTGVGMSPEVCQRLFQAYAQPDPGTARRYGGTGLGLAICKQLVELLGGQISVESTPGQGSCFRCDIACLPANPAQLPTRAQPSGAIASSVTPAPARSEEAPAIAPRFRVLVAEDNRTNQMVAAGMLALNDCACVFAADGAQAVRAAQRERFDLILMDCSMPEMDGYEATAHIRLAELASGRRTPLLAMTANTQSGDAEKCLAAGMDDYLAKPITLVELRLKLEKWLPLSACAAPPAQPPVSAPPGSLPCPVNREVFDKVRDILGDSLVQAIQPYLEDAPRCIDALQQALSCGDLATAAERAHTLKGASANLGAETLAQLAQQAEALASQGQYQQIAPLIAPLRAHFAVLESFLQAQIGVLAAPAISPESDIPQVLIVDDDRSTRSTLRHTLQRDGFQVEEAADGAQALAMLAVFQPDVILMDAMMPVMDGFTACARMQELPHGAAIPVLMITALQDNASVERAFAAGASDYLVKPFTYDHFAQKLDQLLAPTRRAQATRTRAPTTLIGESASV
ncbi:MAG: response regulator, partial [Burkholderiaceae bacterium]|nr:response regulator [Burkholderiaceae bacterium]